MFCFGIHEQAESFSPFMQEGKTKELTPFVLVQLKRAVK